VNKSLYRQAFKRTSNHHDAEDLVQETLLKAYKAKHTFKEGTNYDAWLQTILKNSAINGYRKKDREPKTEPYAPLFEPVAETVDNTVDTRIVDAINNLPEYFRKTFTLVCVEDYSYQQAADIMGVSIGTVMSRLNRARTRLRSDIINSNLLNN
jgi:RNA polymerase sigma-70 factor, ECF subfamily